jgi:hypothetical protein
MQEMDEQESSISKAHEDLLEDKIDWNELSASPNIIPEIFSDRLGIL